MTKTKLCTTLLILVTLLVRAQTVSSSNLDAINGKWEGTLTYTDYQDDVSVSSINCGMEATWKKNKGILQLLFTEPDGRIIKDKTKIAFKKKGMQFVFDGKKYDVLDFISQNEGSWKLILERNGTDNNKPAEIKLIIDHSRYQLSISKLVKYEGTELFFERNRYRFKRN